MSIIGIGFKLACLTLLYSVLIISFAGYSKFDFTIHFISPEFLSIVGTILIMVGVPFLIVSIRAVNKAYKAGSLKTGGVYSVCRHPLYSAWIIFIIPGFLLFFHSWILLTIPIIMYVLFRILIKEEEIFLQHKFGEEYENYKKRISLLFPVFWKYRK